MPHDAYFQGNPTRLDVSRSKMKARPRWSGTWVVGKLFPIFATSGVMPGDTFKMSVSSAIRMVRPLVPVMDDMEITVEAYFVPHRLILSRKSMSPDLSDSNHSWSAFIGAQDSLLNMPTPSNVALPYFAVGELDYVDGALADCLGFPRPQGVNENDGLRYKVNCLKPLAYWSIWNEYFREPNTINPTTYSIHSTYGYIELFNSDLSISAVTDLGVVHLAPVSKYHGYFGSALPWPQRNASQVLLPLGDAAPIIAKTGSDNFHLWKETPQTTLGTTFFTEASAGAPITPPALIFGYTNSSSKAEFVYPKGTAKNNLFADLSTATAASVNQFRLAVQTQRWYEALARSGNKYSDLVDGMFGVRGVSIPDRPEYLGGFTAPINMSQVASTSGDSSSGEVGYTGAFSLSNPGGYLFTKSFTEHGTIMVVACCRVKTSISQGISREDTKFDRFDFYWPQFANLGEQPVLKRELFAEGSEDASDFWSSNDVAVFGYQEAWAEYRMFPDKVTGYLRPEVSAGIGHYTYAEYFSSSPSLKGFLDASAQSGLVDRTLTVNAATAGFQLFGQFEFDIDMVRPMPTYSIPGLVDHH